MLDFVFPSSRSFSASLQEEILYAIQTAFNGMVKASKWQTNLTEYPNL